MKYSARILLLIFLTLLFKQHVSAQDGSLGDTLYAFNAGVLTPTPDRSLIGIEYAEGYLWVTGSDPGDFYQHKLYKFSADGDSLIDYFEYGLEYVGWAGLAYDGEHLWTAGVDTIWQIDIETGQKTGVKIVSPQYFNKGIAYDPETDHFWISGQDPVIYEIDKQGNVVNSVALPPDQISTGLAWDSYSEGGPYLWIWGMKYTPSEIRPKAMQLNVQTGTLTGVEFEGVIMNPTAPYGIDGAMGATITNQLVDDKVTFVGLHGSSYLYNNDQLDWVVIYDLDPEGTGIPGPEISVFPGSIQNEVMPGDTLDVPVFISNLDSSFNLNWTANLEYPVMNDTSGVAGDTLFTFDATALTGPEPDFRMRGIAFLDDHFYVNTGVNFDGQFTVYKIKKDGSEIVSSFIGSSFSYGWSAITADNEYLYAANQYTVDKINPENGQTIESYFKSSFFADGIAYDPQQQLFYLGNNVGAIKVINKDGDEVNFFVTDFEIEGLSWDNWSPGGPYLWAYYRDGNNINAVRLDPNTAAPTGVEFTGINLSLDPEKPDSPEDIFVTPNWQENKLTMIALHDSWNDTTTNADKIVVYDLATTPPPGWIKLLEPTFGVAEPLDTDTMFVRLMAIMEDTLMEAQIVINSNDVLNPSVVVPVNFRMMPEITVGLNDNINAESKLVENIFPNPATAAIELQLGEIEENTSINLYNSTGMLVHTFTNLNGASKITIDVSKYPTGLYHLVIRSGNKTDHQKIMIQ